MKSGTATAGTAPLKFTTGTNLSAVEDGAMEYDGSHIYMSIGSTRYQLDQQSGNLFTRNSGSGFLYPTTTTDKLAVGSQTPTETISINGRMEMAEQSTLPTATAGYGKLFFIKV